MLYKCGDEYLKFGDYTLKDDIGEHIAKIRKHQNLTQLELARIAEVDYNTLRKVESGKTKFPRCDFIAKVACALRVSCDLLIEVNRPTTKQTAAN